MSVIKVENERIFAKLDYWKRDLKLRLSAVKPSLELLPKDDTETIKIKTISKDMISSIELIVGDEGKVAQQDQQKMANTLSNSEDKMTNAGRRLFGIRWNTVPCGAGFVMAYCGEINPCT